MSEVIDKGSKADDEQLLNGKDDNFASIESALAKHKDCLVAYDDYLNPPWENSDVDIDVKASKAADANLNVSILSNIILSVSDNSEEVSPIVSDASEIIPYVQAHNVAYFEGYRKAFKSNIEELLIALNESVEEQISHHFSTSAHYCRKLLSYYEEKELRWVVDALAHDSGISSFSLSSSTDDDVVSTKLREYVRSRDLRYNDVLLQFASSIMTVCREYSSAAPGPWKDIFLSAWLLESALPCWTTLCRTAAPFSDLNPNVDSGAMLQSVTPIAAQKRSGFGSVSDIGLVTDSGPGSDSATQSPYNPTDYSDMDVTVNNTLDLTMSEDGDADADGRVGGGGSRSGGLSAGGQLFPDNDIVRRGAGLRGGTTAAAMQTNRHQLSEINRLNSEIYRLTELLENTSSSDLVSVEERLRVTTMQLHRVQARNNELKSRVQELDAQCYKLRMQLDAHASVAMEPEPDTLVDSDDELEYADSQPLPQPEGAAVERNDSNRNGSEDIPKGIIKNNKFLLGTAGNDSSIKKVSVADTDPVLQARLAQNKSNLSERYRPAVQEKQHEELILQFDGWVPAPELIASLQKLGAHFVPNTNSVASRSTGAIDTGRVDSSKRKVGFKGVESKGVSATATVASESAISLTNAILRQFHSVIIHSVSNDRKVMKEMSLEIENLSAQLALSGGRVGVSADGGSSDTGGVEDITLSTTSAPINSVLKSKPSQSQNQVHSEVITDPKLHGSLDARVRVGRGVKAAKKRIGSSEKEYTWESLLFSFFGGVIVMLLCSALVQLRYSNITIPEFIPTSKPPVDRTIQSRPIPTHSLSEPVVNHDAAFPV